MNFIVKTIDYITALNKWLAYAIAFLMMFVVSLFAITRSIGHPIIGDIELAQFIMVLLIVTSLAFTEKTDSHVSIDLIFDRFPRKMQALLIFLAQLLTAVFCFMICWSFIAKMNFGSNSSVLGIPFYPFRILLIIGFFAWGLEVLKKLFLNFKR
ncbi:hypothetical protein DCC39_14270 [Pueribacillus theae]|uniref:Tripartite ATP-independent periplasmic transporters DctQ component domain-containing protein n=1 Tax=Pueribacillus theae TaxID=2171751 RepID=A0A2U1JUY7_9BACI|nr:TRAP transporter small permease [Pueribacillus theae]PWA08769.1 hypothetical protein DCC39_14270 [Pueribacillus theae]